MDSLFTNPRLFWPVLTGLIVSCIASGILKRILWRIVIWVCVPFIIACGAAIYIVVVVDRSHFDNWAVLYIALLVLYGLVACGFGVLIGSICRKLAHKFLSPHDT